MISLNSSWIMCTNHNGLGSVSVMVHCHGCQKTRFIANSTILAKSKKKKKKEKKEREIKKHFSYKLNDKIKWIFILVIRLVRTKDDNYKANDKHRLYTVVLKIVLNIKE